MTRARSPRFWLLAGALVAAIVIPLGLAGVISVPGLEIRTWLGLADKAQPLQTAVPCTPQRRHRLLPSGPAAPSPGAWRREHPPPLSRVELKAAVSGGTIYLANGQAPGGYSQSSVLAFDPGRRRYARIPNSPKGVDHALFAARRGDLYLVGGYSQSDPTNQ